VEQRYRCSLCRATFSHRAGTVFYGCRTPPEVIVLVLILVAYGCPIPAIVAAFTLQARTVRRWVQAAGEHAERVHEQQVETPQLLGQVQADELRVKAQRRIFWVAMAIAVPCRLWLGAVVSEDRNKQLIRALATRVRACLVPAALLVCVDGLAAYVDAFRKALRSPERTGRRGHPRLMPWEGIVLGQVIKKYRDKRVVEVMHRVAWGLRTHAEQLLRSTQGGGVLNTAYIERLNATFRGRLAVLCRRTRGLCRRSEWLHAATYLIGTVYNFCTEHGSLTLADGTERTPAMAARITNHRWSVAELMWHRIPPPPWKPPPRRGRRPRALRELTERWTM
jgi:transposase-like protein